MNKNRIFHLRNVVLPEAYLLSADGQLRFGAFKYPYEYLDGKFGYCLLGCAVETDELKKDGWYFKSHPEDKKYVPVWRNLQGLEAAQIYYEISYGDTHRIFGGLEYGSLMNREYYINNLIRRINIE